MDITMEGVGSILRHISDTGPVLSRCLDVILCLMDTGSTSMNTLK